MLGECPDCERPLSTYAKVCPHCGYLGAGLLPRARDPTTSSLSDAFPWLVGICFLVVILYLAFVYQDLHW
jgi:hypothetical protein